MPSTTDTQTKSATGYTQTFAVRGEEGQYLFSIQRTKMAPDDLEPQDFVDLLQAGVYTIHAWADKPTIAKKSRAELMALIR